MGPPNATRRPGTGVSAVMFSGETNSTEYSTTTADRQVYDIDGHRLPLRRRLICGAPRLAQPGWYRLAANR
jgi:hypothetical protein